MDITYDLIIKYLVKKNTFITPKNVYTYSSIFPDNFKNILTEKFFKCGITTHDNDNNISFWSSLLTILDKNFVIPVINDEIQLVNQFKNDLIEKYKKSKISSSLKTFDKNDFREMFKINPSDNCIQYIVDIHDINIFIFNFETSKITVYYKSDKMNLSNKSVFLATHKNFYEPIMNIKQNGEIERIFDNNNSVFKNLIISDLIESPNKNYNYDDVKEDLLIDDSDSVKTEELSVDNIYDEIKSMSKYKMSRMKVNELLEITKKINIEITNKPTKASIIELIMNKINS
jgi:hypothetical protein